MDSTNRTAAELGREIAAGRIDPVALAESCLEAIRSQDEDGRIYARLTGERALEEAKAAARRAREGRLAGPLDGVPVSWKDLFDTAGTATESGTPLLAGRIPDKDAEVLRRAGIAGTVCLGKTHQTELAFSGLGINPNTATPPNKGMPGHAPGGSSSGAAASLAHGLAPIAIGSDTGGSVRIPACWNSLVGLKTTHGVLPNDGVVPLCPGFDTVGPLARTVEDAALMFAALGGGEADLAAAPSPADLRLAVVETVALENCDAVQSGAFERSLARIEAAGARVERITAGELPEAFDLGAILFPYEAWRSWGALIAEHPGVLYPPVELRFRSGEPITRAAYDQAWQALGQLRRNFFDRFSRYDAFVMPTVAIQPPRVDELLADDERFMAVNLLGLRNTRIANLLGSCALNLPTATYAAGLQVMARPGEDVRLLQIGAALEAAAKA